MCTAVSPVPATEEDLFAAGGKGHHAKGSSQERLHGLMRRGRRNQRPCPPISSPLLPGAPTPSFNLAKVSSRQFNPTPSRMAHCARPCAENWGHRGTSLVVQWLWLWVPNAGDPSSIPGQGAKIPYALLWPKKRNTDKKSNIVTNPIKTFKNSTAEWKWQRKQSMNLKQINRKGRFYNWDETD